MQPNLLKPISEFDQWRNHVPQPQIYGVSNNGTFGDSMIGNYMPSFYPTPPPLAPSMNYYGNGWSGFYPTPLHTSVNAAAPSLYNHQQPQRTGLDPSPFGTSGVNGSSGLFNYQLHAAGPNDYDAWTTARHPTEPQLQFRRAPSAGAAVAVAPPTAPTYSASGTGQLRSIEHTFNQLLLEQTAPLEAELPSAVSKGTDAANSSVVRAMMVGTGGVLQYQYPISLGHQISTLPVTNSQPSNQQSIVLKQPTAAKKTWASVVKQPEKSGVVSNLRACKKGPISGFGCAPSVTTANLSGLSSSPPASMPIVSSFQKPCESAVVHKPAEQGAWVAVGTIITSGCTSSVNDADASTTSSLRNNSQKRAPATVVIPADDAASAAPAKDVGDTGSGTAVRLVATRGPESEDSKATVAITSVLEKLRTENNYNPRELNIPTKGARYFVIKSYNEDDFHRSIKYGIWCSTEHGNKRLDQTFRDQKGKGAVYFFASVNGSGHFCGVAQMTSAVDYSHSVGVWAQDKYRGNFTLKWLYVKDVPNAQLRHIRLENNDNKPVTNSRDTQEVPADKGKQVLAIMHAYKHTTSLFDDFTHYEKREHEEEERKKRTSTSQKMT